MPELKEYRDLYQKLEGHLKILINNKIFYGKESYRTELRKVILDTFPLLRWLAKESKVPDSEWESLYELFKASYSPENSEIQDIDYSSKTIEELIDEVHYLWVCVKNICNVDLDKTSEDELREKERPSSNYPKTPDSMAVYRNFFSTTVDPNPNRIPGTMDELLLRSHAFERLQHDIETGNIYIYTTKPKRNVTIKNFLSGLLVAGGFVSLLIFFTSAFQGISNGSNVASMLFSLLSTIYFYYTYKQLRSTFLNDNYKYSFQGGIFKYTFLLSFFVSMTVPAVSMASNSFGASTPLWLALCSIMALSFCINLFSYIFLQPKKDKELIDSVLEKHYSDLY